MGALTDVIQDSEKRRAVIDDGTRIIDLEVKDKKGVSGMAVKAGFRVVKGVKPGIIPQALNGLLDDFCAAVDPFYDDYRESGRSDISAYFVERGDEIADALLSITDERAEKNDHRTLRKAYYKLRPQAEKHVLAAMPRVAGLVERHVA